MNIVWPMEMLGWLTNSLSSGIASSKKLKAIYAKTASIKDPENPVILPSVKGKVEFSNVSFHKADGYEILHDISFCVEPGYQKALPEAASQFSFSGYAGRIPVL